MENKTINIQAGAKQLQQIFNIQHAVNDKIKLCFTHDEMLMQGVDPAHIEIISQQIPKQMFEVYEIEPEQKIGIDLDKIKEIFKNVNKNDTCKIKYDTEIDQENIYITIGMFQHKLGLLDIKQLPDAPKLPILDLPGEVEFSIKPFYEFLRQACNISTYFSITTDKTGLTLHADNDTNQEITLHTDIDNLYMIATKPTCKSLFSTEYVYNTVKRVKTCFESCHVRLGNNTPIEIELCAKWNVSVLIAPRIEAE